MTAAYLDFALLAIMLIFAILAFLKGFVRDFFSTLNLILAAVTSYFLGPIITKLFIKAGSPQIAIELGVRFVLFVIILILLAIIGSKISQPLKKAMPEAVDQSLGLAFGLVKGYFILALIFSIVIYFYSYSSNANQRGITRVELIKKDKIGPAWIRQSESYNLLSFGANLIQPLIDGMVKQTQNKVLDKSGKVKLDEKSIEKIKKIKEKYDKDEDIKDIHPEEQDQDSGYTKQEIEKMKRLIEIMGN